MPSMTATRPAASRATAKPCCTAWSTAGPAATRWSCSTRAARYFAVRYVRAREGFQFAEAKDNFQEVSLLSAAPEQQRFAAVYRGPNPESPQQLYGRSAVARITIKSISAINKNVVSVRYLREVRRGEEVKATHWISTLTYAYAKSPASMGDRLVNPLGFTVSEYRSDPEVVQ